MKVIHGRIKNLEYIDGIVGQLPKLQSQAAGTALISIFSESGGMGAAATLGGVTGFPGYYIHFQIDELDLYAAFTGVFFEEGDELYVAYEEGVIDNFNVLAIMNKKNQLLSMAVPYGHTVAMSDKLHNKNTLMMGGGASVLGIIMYAYLGANDIYIYILVVIITFIIAAGVGYSVKKQFRGYAQYSEEIFKKMGVKDLKAMEKIGVEAYIDENNRMYDDVYKYTQFLDYDPQPLVDREEQKNNESDTGNS